MIEPKEEIKQQVIISGHHDSSRIFNFFIHQPKLYNIRITGSIGFVILLTLVSLIRLFVSNDLFILISNILLALGSLLIIQKWFFASKDGTPGTGDNLIASTMGIEIGRYFSQNELKHTRIIIVSFDAEEEGLRGSRAFAKKYKGLLNEYPTTL
jgi:aminopeptidase YwaD